MLIFSEYHVVLIQKIFLIPHTFHVSSHILSIKIVTPVKITTNLLEIIHSYAPFIGCRRSFKILQDHTSPIHYQYEKSNKFNFIFTVDTF